MMLQIALLLPSLWLGYALVRYLRLDWSRPISLTLAACLGLGLSGVAFFPLRVAGAPGWLLPALEVAGGTVVWLLTRRRPASVQEALLSQPAPGSFWALRALLAFALLLNLGDFLAGNRAHPHGEWDATAIWNVKAKFLAGGGDSWRYAVAADSGGPQPGAPHPGYPLLLPGLLARNWQAAADSTAMSGAAAAFLFFAFSPLLLWAGLKQLHSEPMGLAAALLLCASEGFVSFSSWQYADLPLAFFLLSATVLLVAGRQVETAAGWRLAAGLAAGFAAWTKNEGAVFLAAFLLVALWDGGRRALPVLLGALPGSAVLLWFKLTYAPSGSEQFLPRTISEVLEGAGNPERWLTVVRGFLRVLGDLGPMWAHPLLLLGILVWLFGLDRRKFRRARLAALPAVALYAFDFAVFLVTRSDLQWHLNTAAARLFAQVWPVFLFAAALALRVPEIPPETAKTRQPGPNRPKRRRASAEA